MSHACVEEYTHQKKLAITLKNQNLLCYGRLKYDLFLFIDYLFKNIKNWIYNNKTVQLLIS